MSVSAASLPALGLPALQAAAVALGASGDGASRLLALMVDPEVSVHRVMGGLAAEPALAARVLKVANSSFYGLAGRIGTLDQAVQLLGLTAVKGIAASGCLDRVVPPRSGGAFNPERFRRHSLGVASAALSLCREAAIGMDDEAFMAGLLHDIGILLLVRAAPSAMATFMPAEGASVQDALAWESAALGAQHDQAAEVLASAWHWPQWLRRAVAGHHTALQREDTPPRGPAALPLLVTLADQLAHAAGLGFWPVCALSPTDALAASLGIEPAALDRVRESLPDAVAAMSAH